MENKSHLIKSSPRRWILGVLAGHFATAMAETHQIREFTTMFEFCAAFHEFSSTTSNSKNAIYFSRRKKE